jgi:L-seryl-tRNA(Ser) seleniumtransferase
MTADRFGNRFAPGLPYARGAFVRSTEDDLRKLKAAWHLIKARIASGGSDAVFIVNGLERGMTFISRDALPMLDDEIAPALYNDELAGLALKHLGGDPAAHDVMLANRLTAALFCAGDVLVKPGHHVVGVSPRYSHPAVTRAVKHGGGLFRDCAGLGEFEKAMTELPQVDVVFLTRMSVSYEILMEHDLRQIAVIAKERGALLVVDDAGGARAGPALFSQPHALELGAHVVCTGLDKYGVVGPRLGLAAGRKDIIGAMRARAFEIGCEARPMLYPAVVQTLAQYRPERVRAMVAATMQVKDALIRKLGEARVWVTPVIAQLRGEDILELAMERAKLRTRPCVPYEATAGLAMLLLRDHGLLTVHFAGMPPGTSSLMLKFIAPETLSRFGGAERLASAIDSSIDELGRTIAEPEAFHSLLFGATPSIRRSAAGVAAEARAGI